MTEISAFPGAIASRPAPKRVYKPRRSYNDISVLRNSCYRRSLSCDKAVIWRMSAQASLSRSNHIRRLVCGNISRHSS
jgi:hypothetical protein